MSWCLYHNGLLVFLIPQFPFSASLSAFLLVYPSVFPSFISKIAILLLSSVSPAPISSALCLVLFLSHSVCLSYLHFTLPFVYPHPLDQHFQLQSDCTGCLVGGDLKACK